MEFRILHLIVFSLILFRQSKAEDTGTVFFVDSSSHPYLLSPSSNHGVKQSTSLSLPEVGAVISVLLGFAPPFTLSASSSSKLNEFLVPNPFHRPRAVFVFEIRGLNDPELIVNQDNSMFSKTLRSNTNLGSKRVDIQLPGEDEVSVVSLDEPYADYTDKDIGDFASWMSGSYYADASKPSNGELTIPLDNGVNVKLHMSKKTDREFVASLLSLIHNVRRAINFHEDVSHSMKRPAELISGCFDGLKALQEQHGSEGVAQKRTGLYLAALSKIFGSLQEAYKGQIVGVIFFSGSSPPETDKIFNVIFSSKPAPRLLVDTEGAMNSTVARVVLVRQSLAWITGIILLIATLLGIYCLLNMPITRDTLLYSNVKLD